MAGGVRRLTVPVLPPALAHLRTVVTYLYLRGELPARIKPRPQPAA
ncbi:MULTISPECIES: hypothetical protein [Streptomyces]